MPKWLTKDAPENDVIVSSRMRLARNLSDVPFPTKIKKPEDIEKVHDCAKQSILKSPEFTYSRLSDMDALGKRALIERHIISSELSRKQDSGLIKSSDESISVMIMEEDHYRLQSLVAGFSPNKAYSDVDLLDKMLSDGVSYAYDERLGFLTSCPTNAGTGLRASVMMHLPALTASRGIERISSMISKVGMTVRGAYGEGSAASGSFYQISNQVTLGVTEQEIIKRLTTTVKTVMDYERNTRKQMHKNLGIVLEDKIWRAIGVLKNARRMGYNEAQKLISDVALGVALGIVPKITSSELYSVMMDSRPAIIAEQKGKMTPQQRDIIRANMIRKVFNN
ncbi:MAG: protein arginine kinase [Clostridia bacterium]|jgi:protein arginine kinase|nr:protein arginine kinase [Clostridia bacterium]MBT7121508.1 protein arginine kinase [Clostridia bacterium]